MSIHKFLKLGIKRALTNNFNNFTLILSAIFPHSFPCGPNSDKFEHPPHNLRDRTEDPGTELMHSNNQKRWKIKSLWGGKGMKLSE